MFIVLSASYRLVNLSSNELSSGLQIGNKLTDLIVGFSCNAGGIDRRDFA